MGSFEVNLKCDMCGGGLAHVAGAQYRCGYCGVVKFIQNCSEHELLLLTHADIDRTKHMQFEKAMDGYDAVLKINPQNINAHWGMFLAEYGIEYVEEYGAFKPTFHRLSDKNALSNPHYEKATELAGGVEREKYQREAAEIERIRQLAIKEAALNEPYDIFICYKKTKPDGSGLTPEAEWARDYYTEFRALGYKVFWADKSIEGGSEYEPTIFNALSTAKFMIIFASDPEYLNSKWVINEWGRFVKRQTENPNINFCVLYEGFDPYTLPRRLQKAQALDRGKAATFNSLVNAVNNTIKNRGAKKAETVWSLIGEQIKDATKTAAAATRTAIDNGVKNLDEKRKQKAEKPQNTAQNPLTRGGVRLQAFLGLLMAIWACITPVFAFCTADYGYRGWLSTSGYSVLNGDWGLLGEQWEMDALQAITGALLVAAAIGLIFAVLSFFSKSGKLATSSHKMTSAVYFFEFLYMGAGIVATVLNLIEQDNSPKPVALIPFVIASIFMALFLAVNKTSIFKVKQENISL